MLVLVGAHAVAAVAAPGLVRVLGRRAFAVLALVPAAAFVWILAQLPAVLAGAAPTQEIPWIPALGIDIAMRLDALSATFSLLVTGIGALVLLYCTRYFAEGARGLGRFAGVLTAFAGAMLALVWSDDVFVLYVCWELTTVFSFLLVGHDSHKRASRAAAVQALVVTAAGGLTMLVGLVVLVRRGGHHPALGPRDLLRGPRRDPRGGDRRRRLRAGRGDHQVRAGAVPLLAALGDGRADAGQRLPARRGDGEGRRLPRAAPRARARRRRAVAPADRDAGDRHDAARRRAGAAPARPQARPRARHGVPARVHVAARRGRHPGRRARRPRAGGRPRPVQGLPVPRRRRHRPSRRHP